MPYVPHTDEEVRIMLERIGVERIEDLWRSIPDELLLGRELDLPAPLAEADLMREVRAMAAKNLDASRLVCMMGGGTYYHYVPPAVTSIISRAEFYTAYTPYQPEISQGTLQAVFEFQTMVCELLGMEVANASMYDGAEAAAEAVLMAERILSRNKTGRVVLAGSLNPYYRDTVRTYLARLEREIVELGRDGTGCIDQDELARRAEGALAVVVQHPNYFGCLERLGEIGKVVKDAGAVFIVAVTEPLAMGLIEPPGSFGADIVVAEGQSLGIPMGFGGPHLGLFSAREADVRRMPGRLVGETKDIEGRTGFVLTLATREQHIRRARATSNICTNQGLLALSAAIYMSLTGPKGINDVAVVNRARCEYLKDRLAEKGAGSLRFGGSTFNEFVLDLGRDPGPVMAAMIERGFLPGIALGPRYPELDTCILVTVTEMIGREDLDAYAEALAEILETDR